MSALWNGLQEGLAAVLAFFYDVVPSFGLAIILLTIAINLVLFPLTLRQTRATRAFQTIQPEIKRIQKEHKDEPEKMQQELMRVQREAGATPGGCLLPILVQMPIWFALFRVLGNIADVAREVPDVAPVLPEESTLLTAVQSHNIRFLGLDLSQTMSEGILGAAVTAALPYVIMLVLMVATQYFQQWHAQRGNTPRADMTAQQRQQQQTQQMITRIMPLFIGFVSWNFPAGLVLYWSTSNLFRLGQQFAIFAIDGRPEPPPAETPSEKGKPEGTGKKPQPRSAKKTRRRRK